MKAILVKIKRDFQNKKFRTGVMLLGIILGSTMITVGKNTSSSAKESFLFTFEKVNGAHLMVWFMEANEKDLEGIKDLAITKDVSFRVLEYTWIYFGDEFSKKEWVDVQGMPPNQPVVNSLIVVEGSYLPSIGDYILLEKPFAEYFGLKVGDEVKILTKNGRKRFEVWGIVIDASHGAYPNWRPVYVYMNRQNFYQNFSTQGFNYAMIRLKKGVYIDLALERVKDAIPVEVRYTFKWTELLEFHEKMYQMITVFVSVFAIFAMIASGMILSNTISTSVVEQYRDIGILKAIGFTRFQIVLIFCVESIVLGTLGATVGIFLGNYLSHFAIERISEMMNTIPSYEISLSTFLYVFAITNTIILIFTILPSYRASNINAAETIRFGFELHANQRSKLASFLLRARVPFVFVLGAKNVFSKKMRATLTILSISVGVATLTFSASSLQLMSDMENETFGFNYDLIANLNEEISQKEAEAIFNSMDEITNYDGRRWISVKAVSKTMTFSVIAIDDDFKARKFKILKGRGLMNEGEAIAGPGLLKKLGLKVGDVLHVERDGVIMEFLIVGEYQEFINMGRMAYIFMDSYKRIVPDAEFNIYYLKIREGVNLDEVSHEIEKKSQNRIIVSKESFDTGGFLKTLKQILAGISLILVFISAISVFNTMSMEVRERFHEIGVLKACGATKTQIIASVLSTAIILAVISTIIGIPIGYYGGGFLFKGLTEDFGIVEAPIPNTIAFFPVLVIFVCIFASIFPAYFASTVKTSEVLRYE